MRRGDIDLLTSQQVAQVAGVSMRQLDWWHRSGLLPKPTVPAQGRGSSRRFSLRDTLRVCVVGRLRGQNVSLQSIRKALTILEREWGLTDPLSSRRLAVIDGRVCLESDPDTLWDILAYQSMARRIVVIDVGEIAQDMRTRIARLLDVA